MKKSQCWLLGLILLLAGCVTVTSEKNRPGDGAIDEPPPQMDQPERVVPDDPGGWYLIGGIAPMLEVGATFGAERRRTLQVGGELFVGGSSIEETGKILGSSLSYLHFLNTPLLFVGWIPYSSQGDIDSRFYAELGTGLLIDEEDGMTTRFSAGLSMQPSSRRLGIQATLKIFEVMYLRTNWEIGHNWSLMFGFTFPFPAVYLRSY